jgi:hypothetical protein
MLTVPSQLSQPELELEHVKLSTSVHSALTANGNTYDRDYKATYPRAWQPTILGLAIACDDGIA